REEGCPARPGEEAGRPRRELSGRGSGRAGAQVQAGAAQNRTDAARGWRRREREPAAARGAGGDVREGGCGTVHPAAGAVYGQRRDGRACGGEVEAERVRPAGPRRGAELAVTRSAAPPATTS